MVYGIHHIYKNGFNNTACNRTLNPDEKKFRVSQVPGMIKNSRSILRAGGCGKSSY
jgi:hypothetical protein